VQWAGQRKTLDFLDSNLDSVGLIKHPYEIRSVGTAPYRDILLISWSSPVRKMKGVEASSPASAVKVSFSLGLFL
jgi:hypothetical protein